GRARGDYAARAAFDFDLDGLRAPVREALLDLPGLDRPAQFERAAGPGQGQRPLLLLLYITHALRYRHPAAPARPEPCRSSNRSQPHRGTRPTARDRAVTGPAAGPIL